MQGICNLTTIPLRALPTSKSEMVSQLLFGETYRVTGFENGWKQVITEFDNYQGWVNDTQFVE
ncbi:MAG TPA: SH3 domain-containing protein, partial [Bacteroidia bacterium]|nr:SH3 domain-containing protein [Bacteroidia bacterium]